MLRRGPRFWAVATVCCFVLLFGTMLWWQAASTRIAEILAGASFFLFVLSLNSWVYTHIWKRQGRFR